MQPERRLEAVEQEAIGLEPDVIGIARRVTGAARGDVAEDQGRTSRGHEQVRSGQSNHLSPCRPFVVPCRLPVPSRPGQSQQREAARIVLARPLPWLWQLSRLRPRPATVVIAPHVCERSAERVGQEAQAVGREVPTADDEVDRSESLPVALVVDRWVDLV